MTLENTFLDFIHRHYRGDKPLLLGLSGGPDSLALFHLLTKHAIPCGIAHVDHGWRPESGQEALILRCLAKEYQLPFHEKKLKGMTTELACREERIKFFREIYREHGYAALVLGHQRDDQLETVFKRILEGASLTNMGGMGEVSTMDGVPVWRPLIKVEKAEILRWIQDHQLKPFFDSTNQDPKFLRSRMRQQIIPYLSAVFGKEIDNSILNLGEEAKELQFFLNIHLDPILRSIESSSSGYFLDLNPYSSMTPFEIKYIIRSICKLVPFIPSRDIVDKATEFILSGEANKLFMGGNNQLYIDRKRLFLNRKPWMPLPADPQPLKDSVKFGDWIVSIKDVSSQGDAPTTWKEAWKGEMKVTIPRGNYLLGPSKTPKISKWWNNHKVPSFLGTTVPAIWSEGAIIHEFLTGKTLLGKSQTDDFIEISISKE